MKLGFHVNSNATIPNGEIYYSIFTLLTLRNINMFRTKILLYTLLCVKL
jgi:hypothetical protein